MSIIVMIVWQVNLPTNDITVMHEAIPFLPVPVALVCLFLNIVIPGSGKDLFFHIHTEYISGTILSGVLALCMGQPRINMKVDLFDLHSIID